MAEVFAPGAELAQSYRGLLDTLRLALREAQDKGNSTRFLEGQIREAERQLRNVQRAEERLLGDDLPEEWGTAAAHADTTLDDFGLVKGSLTGFEQRAFRAMQERVSDDLGQLRQTLQEGLALGQRRDTAKRILEVVKQDTRLIATDAAGNIRVRTPSGKMWDPEAYSKMLGRTAVADARREGMAQRYLANGVDLVRVVANGTLHETCRVWEGEVLSLTGATDGYPTVDQARSAGLFHPNCRHRYVAAMDLLDEMQQPLQTEAALRPFTTLGFEPAAPAPNIPPPAIPMPRLAAWNTPLAVGRGSGGALRPGEPGIRRSRTENAIIYDATTGEQLHKVKGTEDQVRLNPRQLADSQGNILTHNHPGGDSFSGSDIKNSMEMAHAELRVVTRTHVMRILPPEGRATLDPDAWERVNAEQSQALDDAYNQGLRDPVASKLGDNATEWNRWVSSRKWELVAERTGAFQFEQHEVPPGTKAEPATPARPKLPKPTLPES